MCTHLTLTRPHFLLMLKNVFVKSAPAFILFNPKTLCRPQQHSLPI
jgi:hypothetical protein